MALTKPSCMVRPLWLSRLLVATVERDRLGHVLEQEQGGAHHESHDGSVKASPERERPECRRSCLHSRRSRSPLGLTPATRTPPHRCSPSGLSKSPRAFRCRLCP